MSYRKHREFRFAACRTKNPLNLETKLYHDIANEIIKAKRTMRITASFFFRPIISANSPPFFRILRQVKFIQNKEN